MKKKIIIAISIIVVIVLGIGLYFICFNKQKEEKITTCKVKFYEIDGFGDITQEIYHIDNKINKIIFNADMYFLKKEDAKQLQQEICNDYGETCSSKLNGSQVIVNYTKNCNKDNYCDDYESILKGLINEEYKCTEE